MKVFVCYQYWDDNDGKKQKYVAKVTKTERQAKGWKYRGYPERAYEEFDL